jgi:predicted ATPase/DNA-binding CsgD family transcriptional regulator
VASPAARQSNFPDPLTTLIDREREISDIGAFLLRPDVRLLTLTGPGGVGKTRLALRVAGELQAQYADGAVFVDLAPIRDPALVAKAITQAIGARLAVALPPEAVLRETLREAHQLLVLDNFEQVVEAAPLLTELLSACPRLTMLVTSRIVLRVSGEHDYPVPSLASPDVERPSFPAVASYPAVQLFDDRAQAVRPDFSLTDANAGTVAAIVRRLDGLPLAIELAAARANAMSPNAMLQRLTRRLPLLTAGPRDAPDRLRTMRDAIAWSYDLLPADEQRLFRQLAVFVGGFTLEAAEYVGGDGFDFVLDLVTSLVDKSLLRPFEGADGEPRFIMLETIREFGLDQLAESSEEQDVCRRHAEWCASLAQRAEDFALTKEQLRWMQRLGEEIGNLRAALSWSLEHDEGEIETGVRLATLLYLFWLSQGRLREGVHWLELALRRGIDCATEVRGRAQIHFGMLASYLGPDDRSEAEIERGIALCRETGDSKYLGSGLTMLGTLAEDRGDYDRAAALFIEAVALQRARDDPKLIAFALQHLGLVTYGHGDLTLARERCEEALAMQRALGDEHGMKASLIYLAVIACERGEDAQAATLYGEALAFSDKHHTFHGVERSLAGLAVVASHRGLPEHAARLFGAAEVVAEALGVAFNLPERAQYEWAQAAVRVALGDSRFEAAYAGGRALDPDEAAAAGAAAADLLAGSSLPNSPTATAEFRLTPREEQVLALLVEGRSDREIADTLGISPRTVGVHVTGLLRKLGVDNRTGAVSYAVRHGLI